MATGQDYVNGALRHLSALAAGESPSVSESDDALLRLNGILGSWSSEALPVFQITRSTVALSGAASYTLPSRPIKIKAASVVATAQIEQPVQLLDAAGFAGYKDKHVTAPFARVGYYEDGYPTGKLHLAPRPALGGSIIIHSDKSVRSGLMEVRETLASTGAASYTIGVGGNLSTERPVAIKGISVMATSSIQKPLTLVTAEDWVAYTDRGETGNFGDILYYDGSYSSPTIYIAPRPTSGSLELYTYNALASIASLATTVDLPHGYERALQLALAVELAQEFGALHMLPTLLPLAADAKASIAGLNQAVLGSPVPAPAAAAPIAA